MIETGRSDTSGREVLPGSSVTLPGWQRLGLQAIFQASFCWASAVLVGWRFVPALLVIMAMGPIADRVTITAETRARTRLVLTSLREHRDPGPDLRPDVDRAARRRVATERRNRWLLGIGIACVALVCVVSAVRRDAILDALPAFPLAVTVVAVFVLSRRSEAMADRWLADPPAPLIYEVDR